MLTLKLSKVGNSLGVLLPKEMLIKLNIHAGDTLFAVETQEGYILSPYNEEFANQMQIARSIMKENKDVLRALAQDEKTEPDRKS